MNKMLCRPLHRGISRRDTLAIQRLFSDGALGGYWPADPAYAYEDSAGTLAASRDGVVGLLTNAVTGYPNAIQATTANKPYLRRTPVSNKYWLDSNTYTGALTATFASALGSACTIATVTPEGVTIAENQTVGTTYNICQPYNYNSDVLIINRALTAAEKALVRRALMRNVPTLGSELVTNGEFEVNTDGWTVSNANAGIVNSRMVVTATGAGPIITQTFPTTPAIPMYISFNFYAKTVTGNSFFFCGTPSSTASIINLNLYSTLGVRKMTLLPTESLTVITFQGSSAALNGETQTWDSITARHIL